MVQNNNLLEHENNTVWLLLQQLFLNYVLSLHQQQPNKQPPFIIHTTTKTEINQQEIKPVGTKKK